MPRKKKSKYKDVIHDEFVDHGKYSKTTESSCAITPILAENKNNDLMANAKRVLAQSVAITLGVRQLMQSHVYDIGDLVLVEDVYMATTFIGKVIATVPNNERYYIQPVRGDKPADSVWAFIKRTPDCTYRVLRKA